MNAQLAIDIYVRSVQVGKADNNSTPRQWKPATERVQALADISRLALWCRSNETCALIANPSNMHN